MSARRTAPPVPAPFRRVHAVTLAVSADGAAENLDGRCDPRLREPSAMHTGVLLRLLRAIRVAPPVLHTLVPSTCILPLHNSV
jgi:hypothetical protein